MSSEMKKKLDRDFFRRVWRTFLRMINAWFEWDDAKEWARQYHPAWLDLATSRKVSDFTRQCYKEKILAAYRGAEYV